MATQPGVETLQAPDSRSVTAASVRREAVIRAALVGVFLLIAFWPILVGIYGSWFDENAYMEHGLLVVPAALYMAWDKREALKAIPPQSSGWGASWVGCGALVALLGVTTQWFWLSRMAFLVSLVGGIAVAFGWTIVRALSYPLWTLLLMITPPTFLFERLTLSLQLLASRLGEVCLEALGYSVLRQGNILEMVGIKLSVEEACSGIRSLLAILFVCVLYNYFFVKGWRMKTALLVLAVPIAIIGNAVRIIATGIMGQYKPEWVSGSVHETLGYITVAAAAIGVILTHSLMLAIQRVRHPAHA
jgi:exosortase